VKCEADAIGKKNPVKEATKKLKVGPGGSIVQETPVVQPQVESDEKKTKSQTALKKFNAMFKSRINAKRTILAAEPQKEQEKKPKKPAKIKKRKGKGEDEEIDFNDAFSDDEGIVDGEKSEASDANEGSDSDQSSDSEPPKEEVKPAPKKP
jgi:hypothetical protein